jgi:hypothetical protein
MSMERSRFLSTAWLKSVMQPFQCFKSVVTICEPLGRHDPANAIHDMMTQDILGTHNDLLHVLACWVHLTKYLVFQARPRSRQNPFAQSTAREQG